MKVKYLLIGILFLSACNGRLDEMRPHNMAEADNYLSSFNNIVNRDYTVSFRVLPEGIPKSLCTMWPIMFWVSSGPIM